jgi:NAD(P)H-quinone oxidoreductase subunit J
MSPTPDKQANADAPVAVAPAPGPVSQWLSQQGFEHELLEPDHVGVEQIAVEALFLPVIAAALKSHGFDYLQCQGGYDEGPGERLVCSTTCWRWRRLPKAVPTRCVRCA